MIICYMVGKYCNNKCLLCAYSMLDIKVYKTVSPVFSVYNVVPWQRLCYFISVYHIVFWQLQWD